MTPRVILGIETSCDETAAAIVVDGKVIADRITRQILHEEFGGVVPELASRAHERLLMPAVQAVLGDAGLTPMDVNAVAVTSGPGLAGALLVGLAFAKGFARALEIPFIGVNHIEGHLWSASLGNTNLTPPFLALVISGGHTLLVEVEAFGKYHKLGTTRDDAIGELLDKAGRMIGFKFPAGASIDREALKATPSSLQFPRIRIPDEPHTFSFSGLKTAVLYHLRRNHRQLDTGAFDLTEQERGNICAGLMEAVADTLQLAIAPLLSSGKYTAFVVGGGVSASRFLRGRFQEMCEASGTPLIIPPFEHCTDNGAMIAYLGHLKFQAGALPSDADHGVNPSASLFAPAS